MVTKVKEKNIEVKSALYDLYFENVLDLKKELESSIGKIPTVWPFLLKHFIPHVLIVLFINLACAETIYNENHLGNYAGYPMWPFQALGLCILVFIVAAFAIGVAKPDIYRSCASVNEINLKMLEPSRDEVRALSGVLDVTLS